MRPAISRSTDQPIAIIGGGIIGVTSAVLLQIMGYRTALYARAQPMYEPGANRAPEFATLHAAASVLPHSVASPKVAYWTGLSQAFFRVLSFPGTCGVRRQVHYEVFEDPIVSAPPYAGAVDNFELLTSDALTERWVPARSGVEALYGWKFDAFFCEAPEYVRYLYALYLESGGQIVDVPGDGNLPSYLALDHGIYLNCTGMGAHSFLASSGNDSRCTSLPEAPGFEPLIDPVPPKLIRGHYLRAAIRDIVTGHRGHFFSYNYKPKAEIYQTAAGLPADVYCYPRSDAWILGGSRQEGRIDDDGHWIGDQTVGEEIEFPRPDEPPLAIPSSVLKLNADILSRMTNGQLDLEHLVRDDPTIVAPGIGYRYIRDSESDSVRVSCSRLNFSGAAKYVVHNYGHGGSGFTLSWGCAYDVLSLLRQIEDRHPEPLDEPAKFVTGHAATRSLLTGLATRLLARAA